MENLNTKRVNDFIREHGFSMELFSRDGKHIWRGGPKGQLYTHKVAYEISRRLEDKRGEGGKNTKQHDE